MPETTFILIHIPVPAAPPLDPAVDAKLEAEYRTRHDKDKSKAESDAKSKAGSEAKSKTESEAKSKTKSKPETESPKKRKAEGEQSLTKKSKK